MTKGNHKTNIHLIILLMAIFSSFYVSGGNKVQVKDTGRLMMWEIRKGKTRAYILGSLHYGEKEMYPLDERIIKALTKSEVLFMETKNSPEEQQNVALLIQQKGTYPAGKTIGDGISLEVLDKLKAHLKKQGIVYEKLKKMRPWLLGMFLAQIKIQKLGFDSNLGLENHLRTKAIAKKMEIKGLETMASHINLFADLPREEQEFLIADFLDHHEEDKKMMETSLKTWQAGDCQGVLKQMAIEMRNPSIKKKFIDDRNVTMAKEIEKQVKSGEKCFFLIGISHLPGKKGIINLLKEKGFRTKQLSQSNK